MVSILIISHFKLSVSSFFSFAGCIFLCFPHCWHTTVCSIFCCNCFVSLWSSCYFSHFLSLFGSSLFSLRQAKDLSILFMFAENQLLISLVFSVFLFPP